MYFEWKLDQTVLFEGAEVQKWKTGGQLMCRVVFYRSKCQKSAPVPPPLCPTYICYMYNIIRQCIILLSKEEGKTTGTFHTSLCILTHACCSPSIIESAFTSVYSLHTVFSSLRIRLCDHSQKHSLKTANSFHFISTPQIFIEQIHDNQVNREQNTLFFYSHSFQPVMHDVRSRCLSSALLFQWMSGYLSSWVHCMLTLPSTFPVITFAQNSFCRIIKETLIYPISSTEDGPQMKITGKGKCMYQILMGQQRLWILFQKSKTFVWRTPQVQSIWLVIFDILQHNRVEFEKWTRSVLTNCIFNADWI